jgi:hypothetical protein
MTYALLVLSSGAAEAFTAGGSFGTRNRCRISTGVYASALGLPWTKAQDRHAKQGNAYSSRDDHLTEEEAVDEYLEFLDRRYRYVGGEAIQFSSR